MHDLVEIEEMMTNMEKKDEEGSLTQTEETTTNPSVKQVI
jgi:hypothetical protein